MDININNTLVGTVYERQRLLNLDMPPSASRPPFIGTPTNRSLCRTFVALSDRWTSTYFRWSASERQRPQPIDVSEP
jgi:hypothetical protein